MLLRHSSFAALQPRLYSLLFVELETLLSLLNLLWRVDPIVVWVELQIFGQGRLEQLRIDIWK